jgi:aminoglycoside 2'-N-acetyltransferase I
LAQPRAGREDERVIELRTAHTADLDAGTRPAMMSRLERVVRSAYQLGALGASVEGARMYVARGWQLWRGPSCVLSPEGIRRTTGEDGYIYVLPVSVPVDVWGELVCDWRHGGLW